MIDPPPGLLDEAERRGRRPPPAPGGLARATAPDADGACMRIDVVTIFPEYLEPLNVSLVGKARAAGRLDVRVHDLRRLGARPAQHRRRHPVRRRPRHGHEDRALGRGARQPPRRRLRGGRARPVLVVPTPSGRPFTQRLAVELSARPWLIFTPARYEGIDTRVTEEYATRLPVHEVSIGDYVLAGGEAAVLVITEAVARLLPGVLGNAESHRDDSFAPGADGRPAGRARLHQAPAVARPRHPRGAAQRPPREDRPLAARRGVPPHRAPTAPT